MRTLIFVLLLSLCFSLCAADVYMHCMRGSNNRLNERNENRQNDNRLFDSQNNAKGGYAYGPPMYYYVGSILALEWTAQHSCGSDNAKCQFVLQYMCDDLIKDGDDTNGDAINTIDVNQPEGQGVNSYRGRHESIAYYQRCKARERNKGLFLADQFDANELNTKVTAIYTRQDDDGTRYGTECPEERDYYPYWHPTPWKDIAVITDDVSLCPLYRNQSQNVAPKGNCSDPKHNNEFSCGANGATWRQEAAWGIQAPDCVKAEYQRDNHNGNTALGHATAYNWTIPNDVNGKCVLRLRYNISTGDYPWDLDARSNLANSPIQQEPEVDIGVGTKLQLEINTDQFGRTFEDRSYVFAIKERPAELVGKTIFNVNIKGKRGNIVQVYPAVEYDFCPSRLHVNQGDYIHFQWTGSDHNPQNNDGQGTAGTDRSNLVYINHLNDNYPVNATDNKLFDKADPNFAAIVKKFATLDQTNDLLNDASRYFDGGAQKMANVGTHHFMSTRNNNFSNRSQKGVVVVSPAGTPRPTSGAGSSGGNTGEPDNAETSDAARSASPMFFRALRWAN